MAIEQVAAGAYTAAYGGVGISGNSVGFLDDNGWEFEHQTHGEMVDKTDLFGSSLLDFVHLGANVTVTGNVQTYVTGMMTPFYPWGGGNMANLGVMASTARPIARLASQVADDLVLTVVANTPSATFGPSTITAPLAIVPPNSNLKLVYSSKVRKVPLRFALLPSEVGGTVSWFGVTALLLSTLGAMALSALSGIV